ncbi:TonB-dependent receptor [Phenylobacterium sp.]|uniref:TonB-dependent receptor n=1 Tax=Phenylobacterium sp. TaxID=1871053 RepID=UPI0035AD9BF1
MRTSVPVRTLLLATAACAGALSAAPVALAQDAAGAPAASAIEEIVVTARRRQESLQDVPVTVTAYSAEAIEERGIVDLQRLADAAPGVTIDAFPRAAPRPFFRGIGSSTQSAGGDPSSVAFIDGVYIGRGPMLAVDIYDMERVEVLKGPQGTLWGKNVVGGAVNFITAKPELNDLSGRAAVTLGEYGQRNGNLILNAPLGERAAARIALSSQKNNGFRKVAGTGAPLDDDDRISGRIHVLTELSEATTVLFSGDVTVDDAGGGARFNTAPLGNRNVKKPRRTFADQPGYLDRETGGVKLEVNSSALGWADLTAYVSYRYLDLKSSEDYDGANPAINAATGVLVPGIQALMAEDADSYSAEARLSSASDGPFSWVAGIYALRDEVHRERESETEVPDLTLNRFVADNVTKSAAVFGEANYEVFDGAHLFAGLRYTHEEKRYEITRFTGRETAPVVNFTTVGDPGRYEDDAVTWRVGGDWRLNPNVFAFASVATGFKSGGFQEQPQPAFARIATAPEKVVNYEAGLKTDWLDRRLRLNVSIFQMDYSDLQTQQTVPDASQGPGQTRLVTDTGDATIRGVEADANFVPVRAIELGLSYTYLDATFDRFVETTAILADGTALFDDLSGNRLSRTPKHALSGTAAFTTDTYAWGSLRFETSFNYESDVFDDNSNNFEEFRKARTLWDASVTYQATDDVKVQVWGRNLTDVEYRTHQSGTAGGLFVQYGPPRQFGVTVDYRF